MRRKTELPGSICEEATLAWETFHGTEQASNAEHREFAEWIARSPEHVEAYLRVARTMTALKSSGVVWPDTGEEALIHAARASQGEVISIAPAVSPARHREQRPRGFQPRFAFALAATVLLAFGATWFAWMRPQQFETRFGELRSVLLDDGSRVTLNTASKIEVDLRRDHRIIRLVAGEALFDVAHDASRPFDVYTGESILRAVGTRFDVDVRPNRTTVTVIEGIVSLTQGLTQALPRGNTPLLKASDRVVIGMVGPGAPEHAVHLDAVTSWTQRKLIFEHRALGEVAEEFNRYNRKRILIESEKLRSQKITGVFQSNDPESFIAFLSGIPDVRVRRDDRSGHITVEFELRDP